MAHYTTSKFTPKFLYSTGFCVGSIKILLKTYNIFHKLHHFQSFEIDNFQLSSLNLLISTLGANPIQMYVIQIFVS